MKELKILPEQPRFWLKVKEQGEDMLYGFQK